MCNMRPPTKHTHTHIYFYNFQTSPVAFDKRNELWWCKKIKIMFNYLGGGLMVKVWN